MIIILQFFSKSLLLDPNVLHSAVLIFYSFFLSSSLRVRNQIYTFTKEPAKLYVFVILLFLNVIFIYYC